MGFKISFEFSFEFQLLFIFCIIQIFQIQLVLIQIFQIKVSQIQYLHYKQPLSNQQQFAFCRAVMGERSGDGVQRLELEMSLRVHPLIGTLLSTSYVLLCDG